MTRPERAPGHGPESVGDRPAPVAVISSRFRSYVHPSRLPASALRETGFDRFARDLVVREFNRQDRARYRRRMLAALALFAGVLLAVVFWSA